MLISGDDGDADVRLVDAQQDTIKTSPIGSENEKIEMTKTLNNKRLILIMIIL
jgi:hypothetical protein